MKWIEAGVGKPAIYDKVPSDTNHSPYGIESDSTLSVQKATDLGFDFKAASQWFPKLISEFVAL
jgi:hypothetical protein